MSRDTSTTSPKNRISPQTADPGHRSLDKGDVPTQILDRYLIERDRQGRPERYYRDHRTPEAAFRDHGRALSSPNAYPDSVAAMLRIAQHRGWPQLKVSGDEAFRREVWVQARALGLEVTGYKPTERDRQAANEGEGRAAGRETLARPVEQSREGLKRRLEMAAVVVRTLVGDPAAQARIIDRARARAGLGADRPRSRTKDSVRER